MRTNDPIVPTPSDDDDAPSNLSGLTRSLLRARELRQRAMDPELTEAERLRWLEWRLRRRRAGVRIARPDTAGEVLLRWRSWMDDAGVAA